MSQEFFIWKSVDPRAECCGKNYGTESQRVMHQMCMHGLFECEPCRGSTRFKTEEELDAHVDEKHPKLKKIWVCGLCDALYHTRSHLMLHLQWVHKAGFKECEAYCDGKCIICFWQRPDWDLVCETTYFGSEAELEQHVIKAHGLNGLPWRTEETWLKDWQQRKKNLAKRKTAHQAMRPHDSFECTVCQSGFHCIEDLAEHATAEEHLYCEQCNNRPFPFFASKAAHDAAKHHSDCECEGIHAKEIDVAARKLQPQPDKFNLPKSYQALMEAGIEHSGFRCSVCGVFYDYIEDLDEHVTKEKHLHCKQCNNRKFDFFIGLADHNASKHEIDCQCGGNHAKETAIAVRRLQSQSYKVDVTKALCTFHPGFQCTVCWMTFSFIEDLSRHASKEEHLFCLKCKGRRFPFFRSKALHDATKHEIDCTCGGMHAKQIEIAARKLQDAGQNSTKMDLTEYPAKSPAVKPAKAADRASPKKPATGLYASKHAPKLVAITTPKLPVSKHAKAADKASPKKHVSSLLLSKHAPKLPAIKPPEFPAKKPLEKSQTKIAAQHPATKQSATSPAKKAPANIPKRDLAHDLQAPVSVSKEPLVDVTQSLVHSTTQPLVDLTSQPLLEQPTQPLFDSTTQPLVDLTPEPLLEQPKRPDSAELSKNTILDLSELDTEAFKASVNQKPYKTPALIPSPNLGDLMSIASEDSAEFLLPGLPVNPVKSARTSESPIEDIGELIELTSDRQFNIAAEEIYSGTRSGVAPEDLGFGTQSDIAAEDVAFDIALEDVLFDIATEDVGSFIAAEVVASGIAAEVVASGIAAEDVSSDMGSAYFVVPADEQVETGNSDADDGMGGTFELIDTTIVLSEARAQARVSSATTRDLELLIGADFAEETVAQGPLTAGAMESRAQAYLSPATKAELEFLSGPDFAGEAFVLAPATAGAMDELEEIKAESGDDEWSTVSDSAKVAVARPPSSAGSMGKPTEMNAVHDDDDGWSTDEYTPRNNGKPVRVAPRPRIHGGFISDSEPEDVSSVHDDNVSSEGKSLSSMQKERRNLEEKEAALKAEVEASLDNFKAGSDPEDVPPLHDDNVPSEGKVLTRKEKKWRNLKEKKKARKAARMAEAEASSASVEVESDPEDVPSVNDETLSREGKPLSAQQRNSRKLMAKKAKASVIDDLEDFTAAEVKNAKVSSSNTEDFIESFLTAAEAENADVLTSNTDLLQILDGYAMGLNLGTGTAHRSETHSDIDSEVAADNQQERSAATLEAAGHHKVGKTHNKVVLVSRDEYHKVGNHYLKVRTDGGPGFYELPPRIIKPDPSLNPFQEWALNVTKQQLLDMDHDEYIRMMLAWQKQGYVPADWTPPPPVEEVDSVPDLEELCDFSYIGPPPKPASEIFDKAVAEASAAMAPFAAEAKVAEAKLAALFANLDLDEEIPPPEPFVPASCSYCDEHGAEDNDGAEDVNDKKAQKEREVFQTGGALLVHMVLEHPDKYDKEHEKFVADWNEAIERELEDVRRTIIADRKGYFYQVKDGVYSLQPLRGEDSA